MAKSWTNGHDTLGFQIVVSFSHISLEKYPGIYQRGAVPASSVHNLKSAPLNSRRIPNSTGACAVPGYRYDHGRPARPASLSRKDQREPVRLRGPGRGKARSRRAFRSIFREDWHQGRALCRATPHVSPGFVTRLPRCPWIQGARQTERAGLVEGTSSTRAAHRAADAGRSGAAARAW